METVQSPVGRVRMNVSQNSKGQCQIDISTEFPTVQEAEDNMSLAIDRLRALIKEKGLVEAGA